MQRTALCSMLLLLSALPSLAAGAPPSALATTAGPPPLVCSSNGLKGAHLTPKPMPKATVPPPCYAATTCPDGSLLSCPHISYYGECESSDGCWVNCGLDGFLYCPGAGDNPACAPY